MNENNQEQEGITPNPQSSTGLYFLFFFLLLMILFIPEFRIGLGIAAGFIFNPLFSFGNNFPIYTIIATGIVLTLINTWARHHYTDWIQMAKIQQKMKSFNKVYREVLMKRDENKIAKLKKIQMKYMSESMESQSKMMKATMITMFIVIAIFTWLWTFLQYQANYTYMAVPWAYKVDLNAMIVIFPAWLLIYSAITMPLAWVVQYIFKYFEFRKKLRMMGDEE